MIVSMGAVDSPDILVVLADLLLRVEGANWAMVCGLSEEKLVVVFRGNGLRAERSEERRVGKECRSRWSPYH